MGVTSSVYDAGHTHVLFGADERTGLRTIIAVHSTALGPALGGTRFYPYESVDDALTDALRLSRGMTFKNAAAGLDLGGGKAVIIGDPRTDKTPDLLRAYGRIVENLDGLYITAEDVGTSTDDVAIIRETTRHALGLSIDRGGSGDPSPFTALGVFSSMSAAAKHAWGSEELHGRTVSVQGVGKVGYHLVSYLVEAGCEVVVTDVFQPSIERVVEDFGVKAVPPEEIYDVDADIYAPCALGATLNPDTIPRLQCRVVCGSANNQLATDADAGRLVERGILYAPDFVVNAGGVINVSQERRGYDRETSAQKVRELKEATDRILSVASERGITPHRAAVQLAESRIKAAQDQG